MPIDRKSPEIAPEQIEIWIEQYSPFLLNRAYALLSVKEDAEDVVQEVFLSLCQAGVTFEGRSSAKTWLASILHNKIADLYRRRYRDANVSFADVFDQAGEWVEEKMESKWDTDANLMDDEEFVTTLQGCVEKLPPQWKIVVQEAYLQQSKASDVCDNLQISNTNYWKILQRSRLQLRKCLDINWFNA